MRRFLKSTVLICVFLLLSIGRVNAQPELSQIKLPANIDPGVINNGTEENTFSELENNKNNNEEINNLEAENQVMPALPEKTNFLLKGVCFSGNSKFAAEDLEALTKNFIEKEVDSQTIAAILSKITDLYRSQGYITSFAYIPDQKIKDGILEIAIFEGKIGEINIQGNKWTRETYLKNNIFGVNNFNENEVFNVNSLTSSLNDLNQTDYLKGKITLQKGEKPQTTDIIIDIKEKQPFDVKFGWDNLGREYIGTKRVNVVISDNNLTGFGDSVFAGANFASGTLGLSTGYSVPIGSNGTRFNISHSYSNIVVGGIYKELDIKGNSHLITPSIMRPLYKDNKLTLTSDLSLDIRNSKTTISDFFDIQDEKARAMRLGLNGIREDKYGRWISRVEYSKGTTVLGGSSKFYKLSGNLIRVNKLPFNTVGIFRLSGQYSPDMLVSAEKLEIGGTNTVRGYKEGLFSGDRGYIASLELRRPLPLPYLKDRVQLVAFYDQGLVKNKTEESTPPDFLQSMGVGLRCRFTKFITGNLDLGMPLGKEKTKDQQAVRLHFGLSSDFI